MKLRLLVGLIVLGLCGMAVAETTDNYVPVRYDCDGSDTTFTFSWPIALATDLVVSLVDNDTNIPDILTYGSEYTVTGTNGLFDSGGTVTTVATYSSDYDIVLSRDTPASQTTTYTGTVVRPYQVRSSLDKLTRLVQELAEKITRCPMVPVSESGGELAPGAGYVYVGDDGEFGVVTPVTGTVISSYAHTLLDTVSTAAGLLADLGVSALMITAVGEPNELDLANTIGQAGVLDASWWDPPDDGVEDASTELQAAIDYAIAHGRQLKIPKPTTAYAIGTTLTVGTGSNVVTGLKIYGIGYPTLVWRGATNGIMLDIVSVEDCVVEGLHVDGNDIAGVVGVKVRAASIFPTQRVTLRETTVRDCAAYGLLLTQGATATCDYITGDMLALSANGINLRIEGDVRQVTLLGGSYLYAGTYSIDVNEGCFAAYNSFFGRSETADILLEGNLSGAGLYNTRHESNEVLVTGEDAGSYSPLTPAITLNGVCQDMYVMPWTANTAIDYNAYKPLILTSCHFIGDVNIGTSAIGVVSLDTEFVPIGYSGITSGFTGETDKVLALGLGLDGKAYLGIGTVPTDRLGVEGNVDVNGIYYRSGGSEWTIVNKTADYHVKTTDIDKTMMSIKPIAFTLPPAVWKARHRFRMSDINDITIDPNQSECFLGQGTGKYLRLDDKGAWVEISCFETGVWTITSSYDPNIADHKMFKWEP